MPESFRVSALFRSAAHDLERSWRGLVLFEVVFKLLEAWLILPVVALALAAVLSRAGHIAVSNRDILDFLLTPIGSLYAALFAITAVALLLVEQAGILLVTHLASAAERPPVSRILVAALGQALRVTQLGAVMAGLLALTLAPFVLLAYLTYLLLLSQHDIYFYLTSRPPVFWLAACIGALLLLGALTASLWLLVRWAFALPMVLFERYPAVGALRASRERVRGAGRRIAGVLIGWLLGSLLLGVAQGAGFRLVAAAVLEQAGDRPLLLLVVLLAAEGALVAAWSFVTVVGQALLTRRLYLWRNAQLGLSPESPSHTISSADNPAGPWVRWLVYLSLVMVLLAPLGLWIELKRHLPAASRVNVTAHRGHARAAPENTLAAVRKAIESGADYAEVDVQQTADGVVVLLHDRDLKRVAGDSRRLAELSHEDVRKLDVGSWFAPAFAGERVPTLLDVIELARGQIRLNIELKFFGADRRLAAEVARLVREQHFETECLVTSFEYDALVEARRVNPRLRTGLIVAHALGDVSRLEVDALSVRAAHLSDDLLRAAQRRGLEVHVWTINEVPQMTRFLKRGVDNILSSDPDLALRVRNEWAGLGGPERLVLASRLLLGLDP